MTDQISPYCITAKALCGHSASLQAIVLVRRYMLNSSKHLQSENLALNLRTGGPGYGAPETFFITEVLNII